MLKLIERISGVIMKIEKLIINKLKELNYNLSCCESCTGGMIISTLIGVSGASNVINESYVTYSNEAKCRILGVDNKTIEKYNVESIEVAKEMVEGLSKVTKSNVCISVTGFAGGGKKLPTDGLCYYGIKINDLLILEQVKVKGNRNQCRLRQTKHILNRLYNEIKGLS